MRASLRLVPLLLLAACESPAGTVAAPAGPSATSTPTRDEQVAFLREHASVMSLDPADLDFSDLEPLRAAIGSARVVMLGEATHGDGATFRARARLIRFLHQEMGFDVLAMENGIYDCHVSERRLAASEEALTALRRCMLPHFPSWGLSAPMLHTWDYVAETRATARPLHVAGFDNQFTGTASEEFLLADLDAYLRAIGSDAVESPDYPLFQDILRRAATEELYDVKPSTDEQARFMALLERMLADAHRAAGQAQTEEARFWVQVLDGMGPQVQNEIDFRPGPWNGARRDQQMGENLLWLAREHRKVIVIAHTFHILRDPQVVGYPRSTITMGEVAARELGDDMYALGFSAIGGSNGSFWHPFPVVPLRPIFPGSLEDLMREAVTGDALVDLRGLPPGNHWLSEPFLSRPLNQATALADWSRTLDGIMVLREMTPNTRADR